MPRMFFKSDASFFEKIAIGAVGTRAICEDLSSYGHTMAELENGAKDTKIWKDVKRKRVRIPDLVCLRCGLRVESRAKTRRDISMSHSATDAERAWYFGMVEDDIVAFPICKSVDEIEWTSESLEDKQSYWHSRQRTRWRVYDHINYIRVQELREIAYSGESTKGYTEGSETSVEWDAIISTRDGKVEYVKDGKIAVRRFSDEHLYVWCNRKQLPVRVEEGDTVKNRQILASEVLPVSRDELECPGLLPEGHIGKLLDSPQRTQRFTGIKLARLRSEDSYCERVRETASHPEEDLYVKLEGAVYLEVVCGGSATELFGPYLADPDPQIQLEAIVSLAEAGTGEAVDLLVDVLDDSTNAYFLRSAAAWALGKVGSDRAIDRLVQAFSDVNQQIREEALTAIDALGDEKLDYLLEALTATNRSVAAGSAEALRRHRPLSSDVVEEIVARVEADPQHVWAVWLLGQMPQEKHRANIAVSALQDSRPEAHYAITVLWSFVESWIARHWELWPSPALPSGEWEEE